uniref:Uncharacterized protein n=1 Tax=Quercus lobata TaxID=97700 RepID=A0A7N2N6M4_QUELO
MGCDDMKYDYHTNTFEGTADAWAKAKGVYSRCIDFKNKGLDHYPLLGQLFQAVAQTSSARRVRAADVDSSARQVNAADVDEQGSDPKGKQPTRSDTHPSSGTKRKAVSQKTVESDDRFSLERATNVLASLDFDNETMFMGLTKLENDAKRQIFLALDPDK